MGGRDGRTDGRREGGREGGTDGGREGRIVLCNYLFHAWCMETFRWYESRMLPTICQCME